jgi:hypothetical protein
MISKSNQTNSICHAECREESLLLSRRDSQ